MNYKNFAVKIIRQAGLELKKEFWHISRAQIRYKSKNQIVTKADLIAEKIILSAIRKKFPTHEILSEEAGDNKKHSDYLWVVDPLDGTTNFSFKNPVFGTQLALVYKGEVILAVIYVPFLDLMFVAEKGRGATMNGKKIKVSKQGKLANSFLAYCHGGTPSDIKRAVELYKNFKIKHTDIRQLGAASVELAWVASGFIDVYFIYSKSGGDRYEQCNNWPRMEMFKYKLRLETYNFGEYWLFLHHYCRKKP